MNELFVIACGSTVFFGTLLVIIFGFFAYLRWLRYKETMALVEKGLLRPERENGRGKGVLRWGIVTTALGFALCLGLYPIGFLAGVGNEFPLRFGPWMVIGLLPTFFGLALVLIFYMTGGKQREDAQIPSTDSHAPAQEEKKPLEYAENAEK